MTCTTCAHCDTEEARTLRNLSGAAFASPGLCTKHGGWFNGDAVLGWFAKGCPDYQAEPRTQTLTRQAQLEGLADQGIDTLEDYRMEK